ncbi:MAG: hypothetical protein U5K27_02690 [Desulfotignum sp.]|nr:hypothetical protein [Desulfotignum sp.]
MIFHRLSEAVSEQFHAYDCHVFIFSTGIAVRILAPLLVSKLTDPAVVVLDDKGLHAISLLSGHIGQANDYTRHDRQIAQGGSGDYHGNGCKPTAGHRSAG